MKLFIYTFAISLEGEKGEARAGESKQISVKKRELLFSKIE